MHVTNAQRQQVQVALLAAFPNRSSLAQMVDFGLDMCLDVVAGERNLETAVFDLLHWVAAHDQWPRFLEAALHANPDNQDLAAAITAIPTAGLDAPATGSPPPPTVACSHSASRIPPPSLGGNPSA